MSKNGVKRLYDHYLRSYEQILVFLKLADLVV